MSESRVRTGVVVLAVLGVLDVASPLIFSVPDAPVAADVVSVVLGLSTLVALGFWARGRGRVALWLAVAGRVISALTGVLGFVGGGLPVVLEVMIAVFALVTLVAVALVAPGLRRAPAPARV